MINYVTNMKITKEIINKIIFVKPIKYVNIYVVFKSYLFIVERKLQDVKE